MRMVMLALLAAALAPSGGAAAQALEGCEKAGSSAAMDQCAAGKRKAAEAELAAVSRQVSAGVEAGQRPALRKAEAAWAAYRDAQCAFEASPNQGGTIQSFVQASCVVALTRARVAELRATFQYCGCELLPGRAEKKR